MQNKNIFQVFNDAISNEISIETDILKRLNISNISFTPIRATITLPYIKKYHINKLIYSFICIFFVLLSPFYFLIKLLKSIKYLSKGKVENISKNIILVANGRIEYLYSKLEKKDNITFININQKIKKSTLQINNFLIFTDYLKAYFYSVCSVFYILYKLKNKTDILQVYVAYEWFLVYIALSKIKDGTEKIYFANHYDRWAVMFDQLFEKKELILLQHGILPDDIKLSYKLQNIDTIYTLDEKSINIFQKIFNCHKTNFMYLNITLPLKEIKSNKNTILIIGQPHSMSMEIKIIKELNKYNEFDIYVKPHPLFSIDMYKKLDNIILIEDKSFFPKVDIALSYESTLGLEYENSQVDVLWYKDLNIDSIILAIKEKCYNYKKINK